MYIINAPFLFSGLWNIIKHMIDKDIQKKIHIYSNVPKHLFEKVFIKERTPLFLNGLCKDNLWNEPGPWEEEIYKAKQNNRLCMENNFLFEKFFLSEREQSS